MKKNLNKVLGLGCLLAATTLSSCNSIVPNPNLTNGKNTIGLTWYNYADANMSTYWEPSFKKAIADRNWNLNAQDLQNKAELLNTTVDNLINGGAMGLAINLVNPTQGAEVVQRAKRQSIPLVIWNKEPTVDANGTVDKESLQNYDFGYFVGTDAKQAGKYQAEQYMEFMKNNPDTWDKNGDGKIKPYVLRGEAGHPEAEARTQYSIEHLKALLDKPGHGIKNKQGKELTGADVIWDKSQILDCKNTTNGTSWDGTTAKGFWNDKISKDMAKDVIFSNNDDMAYSIIDEGSFPNKSYPISDKGIAPKEHLPIFGVDCSTNGIAAVKAGTLTGSVRNDSGRQAEVAIDILAAIIEVQKDMAAETPKGLKVVDEVKKVEEKW